MQVFILEEAQEQNGRREGLLLLLAAAFIGINALGLSLSLTGTVSGQHLWAPAAWVGVIGISHFLLHRYKPHRDPYIFPLFAFLSGWGLILIDRLAANFLSRQVIWLVLATAVFLIVSILPKNLRWLRRYRYSWLILGLLLLAATLIFGVNPSGYGAALWLPIPFFGQVYFQPSELLKLLLIIFLASYFEEREELLRVSTRKGLLGSLPYLTPLLLMWGFCIILLVWQRDLGAATIFFVVFLTLLYLATSERRYVILGMGLMAIASIFAYFAFQDLVALRIDAWWNPWPDANDRAFQIVQSLYALASGHIFGQGVGQGSPYYIPVVHSDFVFAAIAEEWGLIGSIGVIICFLLLTYRGLKLAILAQRPFYQYLAAGITILFTVQTLLIMGGVTKLLPLTGVTLPFVSYGGSSLLISSVMLGLLMFISGTVEDATF
jgi:cell division protein FtsW (lipid II flippase)